MSESNLLVSIFFNEAADEGIVTLRRLVSAAEKAQLLVFAGGGKQRILGEATGLRIPDAFNLLECELETSTGVQTSRLHVRYRPAISSKTWARLEIPPDPALLMGKASEINSKNEADNFQLLLSLRSLEKACDRTGTAAGAVFEALHHSVPPTATVEEAVLRCFKTSYPEMLEREIWGYANAIPFRSLTVGEEWEAAIAAALWADPAVSQNAEFQYLFATAGAQPRVTVPKTGLSEGGLTVYRLRSPSWST